MIPSRLNLEPERTSYPIDSVVVELKSCTTRPTSDWPTDTLLGPTYGVLGEQVTSYLCGDSQTRTTFTLYKSTTSHTR